MGRRQKRKYRRNKPRPIIMIDTERLSAWGFVVGLAAAIIDLAVLIVLIYWLKIDMALKVTG